MAQVPYRANLASMAFPFLSELSGRSVIMKQIDQNYVATITSKEDLDKDIGIPQLFYCHNVIATGQGYQSFSFAPVTSPISGVGNMEAVFAVVDSTTSNKAYIGITATGDVYYCEDPYYSWTYSATIATIAGKQHTVAYINGVTYIYFATVGCYKFDFSTHALVTVALAGLVTSAVLGIVAVGGYLLAWSSSAIAWSSLIDPTDFVPSLATGAGGGAVQGARGDIVCCVSHTIGLVIYTNQNAVAAPTSGNSRYPFNFRELVASGGLASLSLVTFDANSGNHFAYTTSGLQLISLQQSVTTLPELTDFLAGSVFEDYDENTKTFTVTELLSPMKKKITLVSDRYLIISYGISSFTHALILDVVTKRWGKVKYSHIDVFEFSLLAAETVETPRRSIAFLNATGDIKVIKIDAKDSTARGVALFGKFQYMRSRVTTIEGIELENVTPNSTTEVANLYSLDGKNTVREELVETYRNGVLRKYSAHRTAVNHSFMVTGAFSLVSLLINFHIGGRR